MIYVRAVSILPLVYLTAITSLHQPCCPTDLLGSSRSSVVLEERI